MIQLQEVGAYAQAATEQGVHVTFGIYLPGITADDSYEVHVLILHKNDHFIADIVPHRFSLTHQPNSPNDLWRADVQLEREPNTHFGQPGTYLYRFQLLRLDQNTGEKSVVTRWFTDPFARATDIGLLSAFTTPDSVPDFAWTDQTWKTPELDDLVVYELNVEEFNSTFEGIIERIPYLKALGISCLELMPVTSLKLNFNWGYEPLHYFAPYERWGGVQGLKRLVDSCHQEGLAVILDVVYQHVDPTFPYHLIYHDTGLESPITGGDGPFGPEIDFAKEFAREYIQAANHYWLHEYHIDGFRYDEVTDLYDGPTGIQYARIAFDTYLESLKIPRFTPTNNPGEYSRLIQCSEAQNRPQEVLRTTYTNGTWQDVLRLQAETMAASGTVEEAFVPQVLLEDAGYPPTKTVQDREGTPVEMPVAPFQYLENHDHSRLIASICQLEEDIPSGDRRQYYKLQPFAIALYTCVGIPMLWQGQEFAENYVLPEKGKARVRYQRSVNWEYFYDEYGEPLIHLYRRLGQLRQTYPALRSRESFYYREESRLEEGIVAYLRRSTANRQVALILLNFAEEPRTIEIPFPEQGTYHEMIDQEHASDNDITITEEQQRIIIEVPSHYGYLFLKAS